MFYKYITLNSGCHISSSAILTDDAFLCGVVEVNLKEPYLYDSSSGFKELLENAWGDFLGE